MVTDKSLSISIGANVTPGCTSSASLEPQATATWVTKPADAWAADVPTDERLARTAHFRLSRPVVRTGEAESNVKRGGGGHEIEFVSACMWRHVHHTQLSAALEGILDFEGDTTQRTYCADTPGRHETPINPGVDRRRRP